MYEIPKIHVPVVLSLQNKESIPGKMFITEDLVSPGGNPNLEEFLNSESLQFFSFTETSGAYRLVNKKLVVRIDTQQDDSEVRRQTPLEPRSLVVHFSNESILRGQVYPTLAEESRVSDVLNNPSDFIAVFSGGKKVIVNRRLIVYIGED